jgi:hypothetical protein
VCPFTLNGWPDLGGVESQLASNGTTVFAAVNNLPWRYKARA